MIFCRSPIIPLQAAIYKRLKAEISDVETFDDPPSVDLMKSNALYPFILIGACSIEDQSATKTHGECLCSYQISVWSKGEGRKVASLIGDRVMKALCAGLNFDLTQDGFGISGAKAQRSRTATTFDGTSYFQEYAMTFAWRILDNIQQGV